jgi:hypothetical protein
MKWGEKSDFRKMVFQEVTEPEKLVWHHSSTDSGWDISLEKSPQKQENTQVRGLKSNDLMDPRYAMPHLTYCDAVSIAFGKSLANLLSKACGSFFIT